MGGSLLSCRRGRCYCEVPNHGPNLGYDLSIFTYANESRGGDLAGRRYVLRPRGRSRLDGDDVAEGYADATISTTPRRCSFDTRRTLPKAMIAAVIADLRLPGSPETFEGVRSVG